jgi:hypothetical protein
MNNRSRIFVLVMLVVAALLTACTGTPFSYDTGPADDGVPKPLHRIEASAEDVIDLAPAGSWDKVGEKVTLITESWNAYRPQATPAGASTATQEAFASSLTRLQTASSAKDAGVTMQAANDLSAVVMELFAIYNPAMPPDIGRLDVFERQIVLDVAANNFTAAAASFAKTQAIWANVKPSVLSHNGKAAADKFEASLAVQAQALQGQDAAALTAEARNGLEIVDELEKVY